MTPLATPPLPPARSTDAARSHDKGRPQRGDAGPDFAAVLDGHLATSRKPSGKKPADDRSHDARTHDARTHDARAHDPRAHDVRAGKTQAQESPLSDARAADASAASTAGDTTAAAAAALQPGQAAAEPAVTSTAPPAEPGGATGAGGVDAVGPAASGTVTPTTGDTCAANGAAANGAAANGAAAGGAAAGTASTTGPDAAGADDRAGTVTLPALATEVATSGSAGERPADGDSAEGHARRAGATGDGSAVESIALVPPDDTKIDATGGHGARGRQADAGHADSGSPQQSLTGVTTAPAANRIEGTPTASGPAAAASPVVAQVAPAVARVVSRGDGEHRMMLKLHPADLGEIHLTVTVRGEHVDVEIAAGSRARDLLRDGSAHLRSLLESIGRTPGQLVLRDLPAQTSTGAPATPAHGGGLAADTGSGAASYAGGDPGRGDTRDGTGGDRSGGRPATPRSEPLRTQTANPRQLRTHHVAGGSALDVTV